MRKLFLYIFAGLIFCSIGNTNDIYEFEIEGISIGDSLLEHLSEKEIIKEVQVGDRFILGGYEITFNGVKREARSNYISDVAFLSINGEAGTFTLFPEKRFYSSQETVTSEVAIKKYINQ